MTPFDVTVHMIVKNEDIYVGYALASVLPFVKAAIIYDTGSTDKTVSNIKNQISKIKKDYPNIIILFEEHIITDPSEMTQLRKRQIEKTETEWFLLVDGDEVWPGDQLTKLLQLTNELPKEKIAVVNNTRNCVGDVWHYAGQRLGKYKLLGRVGHYNIRLMRNENYSIEGTYPDEAYCVRGKKINEQDELLEYSDAWYLHMTHLKRSSIDSNVYGRRKMVYTRGIALKQDELPEVFQNVQADVLTKRSIQYELKAALFDTGREFRNSLINP